MYRYVITKVCKPSIDSTSWWEPCSLKRTTKQGEDSERVIVIQLMHPRLWVKCFVAKCEQVSNKRIKWYTKIVFLPSALKVGNVLGGMEKKFYFNSMYGNIHKN